MTTPKSTGQVLCLDSTVIYKMIGGSSAKIYLWIILNNLADIHTGIVEASLSDLATATRIDKTKVRRLLQAFLAEGLITIEKSFNRHTKTKITIGA
jgi:DNA-binding MarR family transcriptional regulator